MRPSGMGNQCPVCASVNQRGSTTHDGDTLAHRLFYMPLRCRDCRIRYWVYSPIKILIFAVLMSALAFWLAWHQLSLFSSADKRAAFDSQPLVRLTALAKRGNVDAALQVGKLYANGEGVIVNMAEAAKWFEKAARKGNSEAQFLYATALLEGSGVVQDYQAALDWMVQPAARGNPEAQYRLGQMYRFGIGTPVDKVKAYMWFNLAAAQGVDAAVRARESVVGQLKPDQVARAQADARHISRQLPDRGQRAAAISLPPASP